MEDTIFWHQDECIGLRTPVSKFWIFHLLAWQLGASHILSVFPSDNWGRDYHQCIIIKCSKLEKVVFMQGIKGWNHGVQWSAWTAKI